jgi:hypothetical protein
MNFIKFAYVGSDSSVMSRPFLLAFSAMTIARVIRQGQAIPALIRIRVLTQFFELIGVSPVEIAPSLVILC